MPHNTIRALACLRADCSMASNTASAVAQRTVNCNSIRSPKCIKQAAGCRTVHQRRCSAVTAADASAGGIAEVPTGHACRGCSRNDRHDSKDCSLRFRWPQQRPTAQ